MAGDGPLRANDDVTSVPVAVGGLGVAALSGLLLLAVRAVESVAMPVFWLKIACVAADPPRTRLTVAVSMASWTSAIVAGRFIGYVDG